MRGITKPTRQEKLNQKLFEHPAMVVELLAIYFEVVHTVNTYRMRGTRITKCTLCNGQEK
jgi:hypothetical protein